MIMKYSNIQSSVVLVHWLSANTRMTANRVWFAIAVSTSVLSRCESCQPCPMVLPVILRSHSSNNSFVSVRLSRKNGFV